MELDLEAKLIGEALILNISQDPKFGDFLELNDLNEPLELRNHENEDLDHEIEEGENMDEPVIDNMDAYRDKDIGDIIFGKLFCRDAVVKARRFNGLITIHNGNSHPYQKLKGFYKGVLNLGPEYIRDEKMFEWITRGHVSMHEMD
uniref:Uncharacterized protein n=1 Tax=Tanacetum cinerariifolium TaxID=118510 RepID=A0A699IAB7_TANCI|nr:hypothetical protein [Tanacetum cinerariifolium]